MIGIIIFAIVYIVALFFPMKKINFNVNKSIIIAAGIIAAAIIAVGANNPLNCLYDIFH